MGAGEYYVVIPSQIRSIHSFVGSFECAGIEQVVIPSQIRSIHSTWICAYGRRGILCRNPFSNQVNSLICWKFWMCGYWTSRNPFSNQVNSLVVLIVSLMGLMLLISRNPFSNQVNSLMQVLLLVVFFMTGRNPFSNQVNSLKRKRQVVWSFLWHCRNPFSNQVNSLMLCS